jgi:glycerophosphoryl diester phosphodiesterase
VSPPPVVAHRGLAAKYPENTLVAFRAALEAGASYLEVDLQLSADGVAFVHHDWDTLRTCGVAGIVGEQTSAQLASLTAGFTSQFGEEFEAEPLPSLTDLCALLEEWPDVTVFLEIKPQSVERFGPGAVLDAILPHAEPLGARAVLLSFSTEVLFAARERSPLSRGVACERHADLQSPTVEAIDPRHVFCDVDHLPSTGPLEIEGRTLTVWEVVDPDLAQALLARGVDLIESFSCDTLIPALASREG